MSQKFISSCSCLIITAFIFLISQTIYADRPACDLSKRMNEQIIRCRLRMDISRQKHLTLQDVTRFAALGLVGKGKSGLGTVSKRWAVHISSKMSDYMKPGQSAPPNSVSDEDRTTFSKLILSGIDGLKQIAIGPNPEKRDYFYLETFYEDDEKSIIMEEDPKFRQYTFLVTQGKNSGDVERHNESVYRQMLETIANPTNGVYFQPAKLWGKTPCFDNVRSIIGKGAKLERGLDFINQAGHQIKEASKDLRSSRLAQNRLTKTVTSGVRAVARTGKATFSATSKATGAATGVAKGVAKGVADLGNRAGSSIIDGSIDGSVAIAASVFNNRASRAMLSLAQRYLPARLERAYQGLPESARNLIESTSREDISNFTKSTVHSVIGGTKISTSFAASTTVAGAKKSVRGIAKSLVISKDVVVGGVTAIKDIRDEYKYRGCRVYQIAATDIRNHEIIDLSSEPRDAPRGLGRLQPALLDYNTLKGILAQKQIPLPQFLMYMSQAIYQITKKKGITKFKDLKLCVSKRTEEIGITPTKSQIWRFKVEEDLPIQLCFRGLSQQNQERGPIDPIYQQLHNYINSYVQENQNQSHLFDRINIAMREKSILGLSRTSSQADRSPVSSPKLTLAVLNFLQNIDRPINYLFEHQGPNSDTEKLMHKIMEYTSQRPGARPEPLFHEIMAEIVTNPSFLGYSPGGEVLNSERVPDLFFHKFKLISSILHGEKEGFLFPLGEIKPDQNNPIQVLSSFLDWDKRYRVAQRLHMHQPRVEEPQPILVIEAGIDQMGVTNEIPKYIDNVRGLANFPEYNLHIFSGLGYFKGSIVVTASNLISLDNLVESMISKLPLVKLIHRDFRTQKFNLSPGQEKEKLIIIRHNQAN